MWESTVDGRTLHFHLSGINNQNFIMRDEETGTWWQQVSGEAVFGPLAGRKLTQVVHDELTFGLWKGERPNGRVLKPEENIIKIGGYVRSDWEDRMVRAPVVAPSSDTRLSQRDIVVGITLNGVAKAYPLRSVQKQSPVVDTVGGVPILVLAGDDKKSVRVFERLVDGKELQFFAKTGESVPKLVDSQTASEWDFKGKAIAGPLSGKQLKKVAVISDYWFDWKIYHPDTLVDLMMTPQ